MNGPGGRPPEPRIGDKERDAAVAALGEHFAAGRITQEEFEERSSAAWQARTASALAPLFADLPLPHGVPYQGWPPSQGPRSAFGSRGYPYAPPYPAVRPVRARRPRFPWIALMVALVVLSLVLREDFWLVGLVVWVAVACSRWGRSSGHTSGHTSGSRRDSRGTWA